MNWNNVSLVVLGLSAAISALLVGLWVSLVIWTFRDMRARSRDAFAQLLAALMVLVLGPAGAILYLLLRPRETLAEKYERSLEEEALLQDIEERQICPGCKQPIESDYMLCPVCHTRLRQACVHCGRLIHPRWGTCPYCATSQKPVPGVDKAGHVTLLDLEEEQGLLQAEPGVAFESGATLQAGHESVPALPPRRRPSVRLKTPALGTGLDSPAQAETPDLDADLEPPADLIGFEPVPDLVMEEGTEGELDDQDFPSFDAEWEPAEGETDEDDSFELFSVSDDLSEEEPAEGEADEDDSFGLFSVSDDPLEEEPTPQETDEPAEGGTTTGRTPRRLLGLFKRP
jgi:RNA polymerase subunit RPABC4/transcription elongation factor Spt4